MLAARSPSPTAGRDRHRAQAAVGTDRAAAGVPLPEEAGTPVTKLGSRLPAGVVSGRTGSQQGWL